MKSVYDLQVVFDTGVGVVRVKASEYGEGFED
jgi:hypothetical protein